MASLDTITRILDLLGPIIENEVNLHLKSREEARTLESNLKEIQKWLGVAESRQLKDRLIKDWLEKLQTVSYDIEDALEDWEAKRRLQQLEDQKQSPASNSSMWEQVCVLLHSPCSCFNRFSENRTIALEIKDLNQRVKEIYDDGIGQLQLNQLLTSAASDNQSEGSSSNRRRTTTTSGYDKAEVQGRKNDKEDLRKMLVSSQVDDVEVICIVGQGGLGKTTLAKMMYDDDVVGHEFDKRMWVCVSDPFKDLVVAKDIVEQLEGKSSDIPSSPEALMQKVKACLKGKKFLLVLDDVWTEDSEEWEKLKPYLSYGAKGSKILVTTRKGQTVEAVGAAKSYSLQKMKDEECWSIIRQIALSGTEGYYPVLEEVGRKIADKCDGLPLAARILGGLLKKKQRNVKDWEGVLESEIWKLDNVENKLFRHFFLSYDELEPAVKRCFSYCAVFPKDFEIKVEELIRIWMAQGFLPPSSSNSTSNANGDGMEAKGYGYFKDLAQRSFFQDLEEDFPRERVFSCNMHDIVHDFAQYLSRNESPAPPRHLWWPRGVGLESGPVSLDNADKLRGLFCSEGLFGPEGIPLDIVRHLKRVRALSLADCRFREIPEEIWNLIHLRYLDLSGNFMDKLPESICNLYHLQTLVLNRCLSLKFPQGISGLRNLRYIISDIGEFEYPPGIGSLTDLQGLTRLHVGNELNDLRYLKDLNQLRGYLEIQLRDMNDDEGKDVEAAKEAALWKKTSIETLWLDYDESVKLQVVEALRPHPQLPSLIIHARGLGYPDWIAAMENLRILDIYFTIPDPINRYPLPPLWKLPALEHLLIRGNSCMEQCVGNGFYGLVSGGTICDFAAKFYDRYRHQENTSIVAFPMLKTLEFWNDYSCRDWKDMSEEEEEAVRNNSVIIMPSLTKLYIDGCDELETLPNNALRKLSSLETLHIRCCPKLKEHYCGDGSSTSILHSSLRIPNVIFEDV